MDKGQQLWTKVNNCGQIWIKVDNYGHRWTIMTKVDNYGQI